MGIDVKDLPPAYQAQALRKWADAERKKGRRPPTSPAANDRQTASKYHNKPTERVTAAGNVIRFQSQKEARRYDELILLEQAGQIRDLRLQVDFTLQEAYTDTEGKRVWAIRYKADFTYEKRVVRMVQKEVPEGPPYKSSYTRTANVEETEWVFVVEDAKSRPTKTKTYAMKRKMMKERLNIDIQEV